MTFRSTSRTNLPSNMNNANNSTNATGTGGAPASSNPFLESYRAWSERTPWVTRVTTITVLVFYIISFFFDMQLYLTNIPRYTLFRFEVYRLILSPLVGNSILFLIIMLLSYPAIGKSLGTVLICFIFSPNRFKNGDVYGICLFSCTDFSDRCRCQLCFRRLLFPALLNGHQ
jgi:hypothetical protein